MRYERWPPGDPLCSPVFTVASEYALRVMGVVASAGPGTLLATRTIAETSLIPPKELGRVLGRLSRRRFLRRRRNAGGGYAPARPASGIQLVEIIRAFQPLERIGSCPLGKPEHCEGLCPLHRRLDESIGHVITVFGETTLQQMIDEPLRPAAQRAVEVD